MPMKTMQLLLIALFLLMSTACSSNRQPVFKSAEDFVKFKDYQLVTEDTDPQPAWSPNDYRIIVRSKRGLGLLDEGPKMQKFFNTKDMSKIGWPTWLDEERIIVGSPEFMSKTDDGALTQSHIKLRVLSASGMVLEEKGFLDVNAYYPRARSDSRILAQKGESIIEVKLDGTWEEYDQGFFAEPQPKGPGVCLQTVPIIEKDYWTGKTGNGDLLIRWKKGRVSLFPNCFQAKWCANGGVIATRLNGDISTVKHWRDLDCDIVYIPPGSSELRVVLEHAHSPAPNPTSPVIACVSRAGFLYIIDYKKDAQPIEVVPEGERPQWSYDGLRLLTEVVGLDQTINLRVWVFNHRLDVSGAQ